MNKFKYPENQDDYRQVESVAELKLRLKQQKTYEMMTHEMISDAHYRIFMNSSKYLYANCTKCRSRLKWKKDEQKASFKLTLFQNNHEHKITPTINLMISNCIKNLPFQMKLSSMKAHVTKLFNISSSRFYNLHRKICYTEKSFDLIIKDLDDLKYQTQYLPYPLRGDEIPTVLITSSPAMRQSFIKYGAVTAFDVTYNLVKQKWKTQDQKGQKILKGWGVGIFAGKNHHNKIVVFAVALISNQTADSFYQLLQSFFTIVEGTPNVFLSDQQPSIASALLELKKNKIWQGFHFFDKFHIIKNIKKRSKNQILRNHLIETLNERNAEKCNQNIEKAKQFAENQKDTRLIDDFISKADKICFALIPPVFVGLNISTSFLEKLNDLVKLRIEFEKPAKFVFLKLLEVMRQIQQKSYTYKICTIPYETTFENRDIRLVRLSVCESVFEIILKNYIGGLSVYPIQIEQRYWKFIELKRPIYVAYKNSNFECECHYTTKTELPCLHTMCLIRILKQSLYRYLPERWKINPNQTQMNKHYFVKRGRPISSRKNRF